MAIYRFRIAFEDYDVNREIEIKSNQSFEDFHKAIHQSIGYNPDVPSSFYISNDHWHKGTEVTILPNQQRIEKKVRLMSEAKLHNFIEDPHQKFYYISNFDRPFDFHIELVRILMDADPKLVYPVVIKSSGEPPKQFMPVSALPFVSAANPADIVGLDHDLAVDDEDDDSETDDFLVPDAKDLDEEESIHLREKDSDEDSPNEEEEEFGMNEEEEHRDSDKEDDY